MTSLPLLRHLCSFCFTTSSALRTSFAIRPSGPHHLNRIWVESQWAKNLSRTKKSWVQNSPACEVFGERGTIPPSACKTWPKSRTGREEQQPKIMLTRDLWESWAYFLIEEVSYGVPHSSVSGSAKLADRSTEVGWTSWVKSGQVRWSRCLRAGQVASSQAKLWLRKAPMI